MLEQLTNLMRGADTFWESWRPLLPLSWNGKTFWFPDILMRRKISGMWKYREPMSEEEFEELRSDVW
jgi:hypothetical protein